MSKRILIVMVAALVAVSVLNGCFFKKDPYANLTEEQKALIQKGLEAQKAQLEKEQAGDKDKPATTTKTTTTDTKPATTQSDSGKVVVPDGTKVVADKAYYNKGITSVTIPNGVESIGHQAFQSNKLTSVTFPNSIGGIGEYAFSGNNLTSVVIPSKVESIPRQVFAENQLTSVNLGNVERIEHRAFGGNNLTSVTIPASVSKIVGGAFEDNPITKVVFMGDNTDVYTNAFDGWSIGGRKSNSGGVSHAKAEKGTYIKTSGGYWDKEGGSNQQRESTADIATQSDTYTTTNTESEVIWTNNQDKPHKSRR